MRELTDLTPTGFVGVTARLGLKADADDFALVASDRRGSSAAVFTQSRFAGPSVAISRSARDQGTAFRGVVVVAKNANVATGPDGETHARWLRERAAELSGCAPEEMLVASTGVIGVPYPMATLASGLAELTTPLAPAELDRVAAAIMTTDTHPKLASRRVGAARITGVAKGVGMIEPDMATLLTFFFTDADIPGPELQAIFARVVARSFNALSIDTDTSTSDTAAVLANGAAGPVDLAEFEQALAEVALDLVRMIARDGEGASKLIEVRVTGARDDVQAKMVAKSVVNSPLVKTAVHGADPNWGRVAMAIGKCSDQRDIDPDRVRIGFGDHEVYPRLMEAAGLAALSDYLEAENVVITADLGIGSGAFTSYGCDLTDGYIRINADYTT